MHTTFKANANQLDKRFLDAIKTLFKDQDVEISISNLDETEYLLSNVANRRQLAESIVEYKNKQTVSFSYDDFLKKYNHLIDD